MHICIKLPLLQIWVREKRRQTLFLYEWAYISVIPPFGTLEIDSCDVTSSLNYFFISYFYRKS